MALIHMIKLNLGQVWLTYFIIYFVFIIIRLTNKHKDVINVMIFTTMLAFLLRTQDCWMIMEYIVVLVKSSHIVEGLVSQKKIRQII